MPGAAHSGSNQRKANIALLESGFAELHTCFAIGGRPGAVENQKDVDSGRFSSGGALWHVPG
jgi:hypothetical protein